MVVNKIICLVFVLVSMVTITAHAETQILECANADGSVSLTVAESFANGVYEHSGAILKYQGISYRIGRYSTGYDQLVGESNIATLFSVSIPSSSPSVNFTFEIPRDGTSLQLNSNVATTILTGNQVIPAACHTL